MSFSPFMLIGTALVFLSHDIKKCQEALFGVKFHQVTKEYISNHWISDKENCAKSNDWWMNGDPHSMNVFRFLKHWIFVKSDKTKNCKAMTLPKFWYVYCYAGILKTLLLRSITSRVGPQYLRQNSTVNFLEVRF